MLGLWNDRNRPSGQVKALAEKHIQHLAHCCHGDDRLDCPILETLAGAADDRHPLPG